MFTHLFRLRRLNSQGNFQNRGILEFPEETVLFLEISKVREQIPNIKNLLRNSRILKRARTANLPDSRTPARLRRNLQISSRLNPP